METRDHYRAECVCGEPVKSYTRETKCSACGRILVFEWGREPEEKRPDAAA